MLDSTARYSSQVQPVTRAAAGRCGDVDVEAFGYARPGNCSTLRKRL